MIYVGFNADGHIALGFCRVSYDVDIGGQLSEWTLHSFHLSQQMGTTMARPCWRAQPSNSVHAL